MTLTLDQLDILEAITACERAIERAQTIIGRNATDWATGRAEGAALAGCAVAEQALMRLRNDLVIRLGWEVMADNHHTDSDDPDRPESWDKPEAEGAVYLPKPETEGDLAGAIAWAKVVLESGMTPYLYCEPGEEEAIVEALSEAGIDRGVYHLWSGDNAQG